jgi:hypothetical protein
MRKKILSLLSLALLFSVTGCRNQNEIDYGPSITRKEAITLLTSASGKTNATDYVLPTAFEAKITVPFLALILVVPRVDQIVYSQKQEFYSDIVGGDTYWAFRKDDQMIEAQSVSTAQGSSESKIEKTYQVVNKSFTDAAGDMKPTFSPYAENIPANALRSRPKEILTRLNSLESDGSYSASATTYTVRKEEYRSNGEGNLFIAFEATPADGSNRLSITYVFKNSLLVQDDEKQTLVGNLSEYTWAEPTVTYPDLSTFTLKTAS